MSQYASAAMVLSGGGALGAAHLGVVQVLEEKGLKFDFLAGVSAGAIIAALMACGQSAAGMITLLDKVKLFGLLFELSKSYHGLVRGNKVQSLLDELYEGRTFADISVPLFIGATDFSTGERIIIRQGSLADAVRASISVPVIFEPFFHPGEKRWCVDGGLTQNLPLDLALDNYQGKRIYAVDVCSSIDPSEDFSTKRIFGRTMNLKRVALRSLRIMFRAQQSLLPDDARVVRIAPDLADFSGFDGYKLKQIMQRGREAAEQVWRSATAV